jgi:hypothetical protein
VPRPDAPSQDPDGVVRRRPEAAPLSIDDDRIGPDRTVGFGAVPDDGSEQRIRGFDGAEAVRPRGDFAHQCLPRTRGSQPPETVVEVRDADRGSWFGVEYGPERSEAGHGDSGRRMIVA